LVECFQLLQRVNMPKHAADGGANDGAPEKKRGFKLPDCPFAKSEFLSGAKDIKFEFELKPKAFGPGGFGWQGGGGVKKLESVIDDKTAYVRASCIANAIGSKDKSAENGMSAEAFLKKAKPIKVTVDAWPCEFSTGSFGWMAHRKQDETVDGQAFHLQLNANMPIDKSKDVHEKSPEDPMLPVIATGAIKPHLAILGTASAQHKDDLTKIRGIGPWIQQRLNKIGIFTFRQLSKMTLEIEQAVNVAIEYFPGRVHRDEWCFQAQKMVSGKWEELNPVVPASGKSQTVTVDGEEFERRLMDIADYSMKDGIIEFYEAEAIWWSASDGNQVTDLERKTMSHILASEKYKLDEEATSYLKGKLETLD